MTYSLINNGDSGSIVRTTLNELITDANNAGVISGTWSQLDALKSANELISGKKYLLTDFQTIYDRPDYSDASTPKVVIETITSAVTEPLILTAASTNEFHIEAISTLYPNDYIEYQFDYLTYVNSAPTKGRINLRRDTINILEAEFDWRTVTYKRYDHADGLGYAYYYDDGNDLFDLYTLYGNNSFNNICSGYNHKFISDNSIPFDFSNNVLGVGSSMSRICKDNIIISSWNNTIIESVNGFKISRGCRNNIISSGSYNTFGEDCGNNKIGYGSNNNIFGSTLYLNILGDNCTNNKFGNNCNGNTIGNSFNDNEVGDDFVNNTISSNCNYNTIGNNCNGNTIGSSFEYNIIGSGCNGNTIGSGCYDNSLGDSVTIILGTNSSYNSFIGNNSGITLTTGAQLNTVNNTIGSLDLTSATHVYANYDCTILRASDASIYLQYFTGTTSSYVSPTS